MLRPNECPDYELLCKMTIDAHAELDKDNFIPLQWPQQQQKQQTATNNTNNDLKSSRADKKKQQK